MAGEEIAAGSFIVGDGFDVDEPASEGEDIHGRNLTFPDWLRFSRRLKKQDQDPSTRVSRAGECAREPSATPSRAKAARDGDPGPSLRMTCISSLVKLAANLETTHLENQTSCLVAKSPAVRPSVTCGWLFP